MHEPSGVATSGDGCANPLGGQVVTVQPKDQPLKRRLTRYWPLATIILILSCLAGFVFPKAYPLIRHPPVAKEMDVAILRLAVNRPPDLTDDQWAYCVAWTWNLHGNYGTSHTYVPTHDLARIERELQERIDNGADLATIDWIWDQYMQSYPRARHYDGYRPTAPHNKAAFDAGHHGGNPLSQWRADYKQKLTQLDGRWYWFTIAWQFALVVVLLLFPLLVVQTVILRHGR